MSGGGPGPVLCHGPHTAGAGPEVSGAQAEQNIEVQASYYDKLQHNILEINQIRHDLSNQLRAAYRLLDEGSAQQAGQLLDELSRQVSTRVGTRYTPNLLADAVLSEKAEDCAQKGLALEVTAELPPQLPVRNAHLCSVFSNLLDNGIAGALESGAEDKRLIMEARLQSGYLVVSCQNPCLPQPAKPRADRNDPLRRHGLGLEILRTLANMYDGSLSTRQADGRFTATVMLRCGE